MKKRSKNKSQETLKNPLEEMNHYINSHIIRNYLIFDRNDKENKYFQKKLFEI